MAKAKFFPADEVESLSKKIIQKYHSILIDARIKYSFKDGTWNKNGNPCPGDIKKMSPYISDLAKIDFGMIINYKLWLQLNFEKRSALIDHLLSHCSCDEDKEGNKKWIKINHTVEEFPEVARRHGTYTEELKFIKDALTDYEKESQHISDLNTIKDNP